MGVQEKQVEMAIKNPELIVETEAEILTRTQAEQLYYNSGGRARSGVGGYEAGWKAAKAYYGNKQPLPTIAEMSGLVHDFTDGKSMKEYMQELSDE